MGIPTKEITATVSTQMRIVIPQCFDTETFLKNASLLPQPCLLEEQLKELKDAGIEEQAARDIIDVVEAGEIVDIDIEDEEDIEEEKEATYSFWAELPVGWFCRMELDPGHWIWVEKESHYSAKLSGFNNKKVTLQNDMEPITSAQDCSPYDNS